MSRAAIEPTTAALRVAFDHQVFATQAHGGISRYFAALAVALGPVGIEARIVAPLHVNHDLGRLPPSLVTGFRLADGDWARRASRIAGDRLGALALATFRPAVVHQTYYPARPAGGRYPIVTTVHDMIHELFPASFEPGDPTAARKAAAIARADHVICVSEATARDLVALHPAAAAKVSVVPHGFAPFAGRPVAPRHPRPYLFFLGHRHGYKNFAGLVAALAVTPTLRDFDLVAVGGGSFTATELAAIADTGLGGRVHHRAADDAQLAGWMRGAAAFVYPSLYEGFGFPLLEAMAAGTPVIALAGGAVSETCGDAARLVPRGDPEALGDAIAGVVLSPSTPAQLIAAGERRVAQFDWQRCAALTAEIYRGLA